MRLAMMRAVLAVPVVVGCVFAAGLVQAYEARVFEGAFVDATVEDLYPRTAESGKMYYSE
jgi:hypothetical protein